MRSDVDFSFPAKDLEMMFDWISPASRDWRAHAIKQLWLDNQNFDFCKVIRHPAFASDATELAVWHRLVQKFVADYQRRTAAEIPLFMKMAPAGDIRLPPDPWLHAREAAWYADAVRELRQDLIDGGYWFRKKRSRLDNC